MSNIPISSLPLAISLDGTESVPLVQGGTTKRAPVSEISSFPANTGTFVTATAQPLLTQSRVLAAESGVTTVTDGGAQGPLTVGISSNGIGNAQLRQGSALSVIGNATNATSNVADIQGTANQILRVNTGGTALGFGSIDLGQSAAVGTSVLLPANGGTGVNNGTSTLTLAGNLTTSGAFASTFTMTGPTSVTFPTSGTLATTSGPSLPSVAQGDLLYGSAANVLSTLAKNTTASRYLSNSGTSNNPAWAQVDLSNGVTGTLPATSGGTAQSTYATGDTLYASGTDTLAKLAGNTTATKQYLSQTGTGSASAAPVWATIAGGDITGAALTAANDTNVTLTLGGTPATSLLRATSITAGWTGQLSLARGGTNANLTASNGGIFYSTASAGAILAGTATARQMLQSGTSAAPAWSTATWPATTTANQLLYSSSANTVAGLATANGGVLNTSTGGVPSITATPVLGVPGTSTGSIGLAGLTSGTATITAQATAGSPTLTLPNASGTFAVSVATPLSLSATTGAVSWAGTSGGIPYFSSATTAASSAALTANALVLGGGAGAAPSTPVGLGTTTTVLHGNAAGAPSFGQIVAADVTTNTLTNATLAQASAYTFKGNPTASTANVQDFNPSSLTHKASPTTSDLLIVTDVTASNAIKYATIAEVVGSIGTGVTSIAGNTGAFTLSNGITNSTNDIRLANIATGKMLANTSGSTAIPTATDIPNLNRVVFTVSGTFTTPSNSTTATKFRFTIVGAGGGGGGANGSNAAAGGGAGGSGVCGTISGFSAGSAITINIGAAGSAGSSSGGNGGKGGDTSVVFSGLSINIVAGGGGGGLGSTASGDSGRDGGASTGFSGTAAFDANTLVAVEGAHGGRSFSVLSISLLVGGVGGVGPFGLGAGGIPGSFYIGYVPTAATGYGAGGGGAIVASAAGSAGTGGIVIVEWVL